MIDHDLTVAVPTLVSGPEHTPVNCHYSALGLAYNLAAAMLGGTAPLIATALVSSPLGIQGQPDLALTWP